MEVHGQFHAMATLPPKERNPANHRIGGCRAQSQSRHFKMRKICCTCWESTTASPSLYPSNYIYWAITSSAGNTQHSKNRTHFKQENKFQTFQEMRNQTEGNLQWPNCNTVLPVVWSVKTAEFWEIMIKTVNKMANIYCGRGVQTLKLTGKGSPFYLTIMTCHFAPLMCWVQYVHIIQKLKNMAASSYQIKYQLQTNFLQQRHKQTCI